MMDSQALLNLLWKKDWTAVRFFVFSVLGLFLMLGSWIILLDRYRSIHRYDAEMTPVLLIPLTFLGAVMMLFGVDKWGRWGYLLVLLSVPVFFSFSFLLPNGSMEVRIIVPALAVAGTYLCQ